MELSDFGSEALNEEEESEKVNEGSLEDNQKTNEKKSNDSYTFHGFSAFYFIQYIQP